MIRQKKSLSKYLLLRISEMSPAEQFSASSWKELETTAVDNLKLDLYICFRRSKSSTLNPIYCILELILKVTDKF